MRNRVDPVERELMSAMVVAADQGDNDRAYELAIDLKRYRELYKSQDEEWDPS